MDWNEIQQKMQWVHQRSSVLRQTLDTLGEAPDGFQEALDQLSLTLEELHVAVEEAQTTRALLESERWNYQDLFEFAPDGYLVTDVSGTIQVANQTACRLLGRQQNYLIGKAVINVVALAERRDFRQKLAQLHAQPALGNGSSACNWKPDRL